MLVEPWGQRRRGRDDEQHRHAWAHNSIRGQLGRPGVWGNGAASGLMMGVFWGREVARHGHSWIKNVMGGKLRRRARGVRGTRGFEALRGVARNEAVGRGKRAKGFAQGPRAAGVDWLYADMRNEMG
jgi:hypothetical protein